MSWTVKRHEEFEKEFNRFPIEVRDAFDRRIESLKREGPSLGHPQVKTLKTSERARTKELRCEVKGEAWRIAFAFDSNREAILLAGGKKSGMNQDLFYKRLIAQAEKRYAHHIAREK